MKQSFNPYLPSFEYVPDAEPHIFDGRVYIYGSHDRFNGISFCLNDYVCYSASVEDLSNWRYEGVIYRKAQDGTKYRSFLNSMFAPDVCKGSDGRYYLYYFIGYSSRISVAVCNTPAGKFEFLGYVKYSDGVLLGQKGEPLQFDPGVFVDDDKKTYLYTGFGPVKYPRFLLGGHRATEHGAMCFELDEDMLTIKGELNYIGVPAKPKAKGTSYEGHEFFEASSMRKFNDTYYFVYSSYLGHELCYAVGKSPKGPFSFGGTLVSIGDIGLNGYTDTRFASNMTGNTHGSIIQIKDKYFVFYHRQTNRHQFSRQACAEQIFMRPDGGFDQVEVTSLGLNQAPLKGQGEYEARIACNLWGKNKKTRFYGVFKGIKNNLPYFTQDGKDRENTQDGKDRENTQDDHENQYIANLKSGSVAGFKYFDFKDSKAITINIKGNAKGIVKVFSKLEDNPVATILIKPCKTITSFSADLSIPNGTQPLFFTFIGKGRLSFHSFTLS